MSFTFGPSLFRSRIDAVRNQIEQNLRDLLRNYQNAERKAVPVVLAACAFGRGPISAAKHLNDGNLLT